MVFAQSAKRPETQEVRLAGMALPSLPHEAHVGPSLFEGIQAVHQLCLLRHRTIRVFTKMEWTNKIQLPSPKALRRVLPLRKPILARRDRAQTSKIWLYQPEEWPLLLKQEKHNSVSFRATSDSSPYNL